MRKKVNCLAVHPSSDTLRVQLIPGPAKEPSAGLWRFVRIIGIGGKCNAGNWKKLAGNPAAPD